MKGVKLERDFQRGLIAEIKERLPGCLVMKTDPNYIQGALWWKMGYAGSKEIRKRPASTDPGLSCRASG